MIVGGLAIVAVCVAIRYLGGGERAAADDPRPAAAPRSATRLAPVEPAAAPASVPVPAPAARIPAGPQPRATSAVRPASATVAASKPPGPRSAPAGDPGAKLVAQVNGMQIAHDELAQECLRHYGKEVLESMINKFLIAEECKRRNIVITRGEVDAEIERMAQRFSLPVDQWLKMLKQERGVKATVYANDIIWPMLALRKLAGDRLRVTQDEVRQAFEVHYGPSVRCRLIACKDQATAEKVRAAALAQPAEFGNLAKQHSEDSSASVKGLIPPIRRHGSFPEVERTAFALQDGEISPVIPVGEQFVILMREALLPGAKGVDYAKVAPQMEEIVKEKKMRGVSAEIFQQLQQQAKVENVLNDTAKSRAMPGVAATINGAPLTLRELAEECCERYGEDVLGGLINHKLIEAACKKRNVAVTEADLDAEIARAAAEMGAPDVETWLKTVTAQQKVSEEVYRRDAVWPSVALRKLAGDEVQVSDDDLRKGFEANYGPRVRCRAIVLGNPRRAQEVWEMARKRPTIENFGNLAEAYSIEPGSQALRGEVPPIQRHGGQPALEKEAFAMKPGELSGIIQVGDKYIILFCEGHTEPVQVTFAEVREELYKDIFAKKQRLAMGQCFEHLQETATIDNYLAGTTTAPQTKKPAGPDPAGLPAYRQSGPEEPRRPVSVGSRPGTTRTR
jgi:parvulin-like peptidyl-prolyl isomerase